MNLQKKVDFSAKKPRKNCQIIKNGGAQEQCYVKMQKINFFRQKNYFLKIGPGPDHI